ncbi:piggyBac transposable element-derived protein 4-like [Salvelinus sp. IW2-2015]|uniref:piggyBac transposable element-derived protein 4-like n=1 Tax=Salvelinus sp. IW2-2015 TaxID=2691554 RepID=UPI0038D38232
MSLENFHIIPRIIRFDNRDTRAARQLAAIRSLWDKWVDRLPPFYNPGPNVTVDEQLMLFRGRCPFRQYIPSKPTKYGIKIWATCDAASPYAWNLQVYTGKPNGGAPEKNQGMRVVLDVKQGHRELSPQLLNTRNRPINSTKFVFTADMSLVSYVPKKGKNVVLMRALHRDRRICGQEHQKTEIIMDYNATKGGVDNLDKLVTGDCCKRRTLRWPLVIFFNILDISAYNTFVIWMALNPDWNRGKLQRRRLFLEELGKALVRPEIQRKQHIPRSPASVAIVRRILVPHPPGPQNQQLQYRK